MPSTVTFQLINALNHCTSAIQQTITDTQIDHQIVYRDK